MEKLSDLINIGKVSEKQLNDIGIYSLKELKEIGSREAWLKIKEKDPSTCINKLRAFEGAIQGVKKNLLNDNTKKSLNDFYREFK
ncbi:MAG: TfoX/Sxy family protein [Methanobrevibacter sp.]|jgi:DNA transformation protein|nr:TfoX/Sxy family protein [Candidatus Methanovirga meridionalis]